MPTDPTPSESAPVPRCECGAVLFNVGSVRLGRCMTCRGLNNDPAATEMCGAYEPCDHCVTAVTMRAHDYERARILALLADPATVTDAAKALAACHGLPWTRKEACAVTFEQCQSYAGAIVDHLRALIEGPRT